MDSTKDELLASVAHRGREIGEAILTRIEGIGALPAELDVEYRDGVKRAVEGAIDHTIAAGRGVEEVARRAPDAVLAQTRLAALRGTPLEVVLRRYHAGHALLSDFVAEEAGQRRVPATLLRAVLRSQALATERALEEISTAYRAEVASIRPASAERRQAERVRGLLRGELTDASGLEYDLRRWHIGILEQGGDLQEQAGDLARELDASRLVVPDPAGPLALWLGWNERPDPERVSAVLSRTRQQQAWAGIGEPAFGRTGWRLTHDQARAALPVAARVATRISRYADVSLLAAALENDLLSASLRLLYLDPLTSYGGGGEVLLITLKAYLDADWNVTSTAASLGVSRNTVTNRLRAIERKIGHLTPSRTADLTLALRLNDLGSSDRASARSQP